MTPAMHVDAFSMGVKIFARRHENSKCNAQGTRTAKVDVALAEMGFPPSGCCFRLERP